MPKNFKSSAPENNARRSHKLQNNSQKYDYIVGRNPIKDAIGAGARANAIYILDKSAGKDDYYKLALKYNIKYEFLEQKAFEKKLTNIFGRNILGGHNIAHQGAILETKPFKYAALKDLFGYQTLIALDGVTDIGNFGSIIRSSAAFGAGVVIPSHRSADIMPSVYKTSAGCVLKTAIAKVANLHFALNELKRNGFFIAALDGDGTVNIENSALIHEKCVLVMGSEHKGVSKLIKSISDEILRIDISQNAESLNVAIAASIGLYEAKRQ